MVTAHSKLQHSAHRPVATGDQTSIPAVDVSEIATDEDLLIDFRDVIFTRGGRDLLGPVTWQVELDERWVILGPNGAGKTTLIRLAGAEEFPLQGGGLHHGRAHR